MSWFSNYRYDNYLWVRSQPARDGQLGAISIFMCVVLSFDALIGALIFEWGSYLSEFCGFDPNRLATDNFVLSVFSCVWFLTSMRYYRSTHIWMGELPVWIVLPTVAVCMYKSSPLVSLDSCLTASACVFSAYSFAVSQDSDLALLVRNVS